MTDDDLADELEASLSLQPFSFQPVLTFPVPPPPSPTNLESDVCCAVGCDALRSASTDTTDSTVSAASAASAGDVVIVKACRPAVEPRYHRQRHTLLSDAAILRFHNVHGPKWRELSRSLGGRDAGWSDDTCRNRYIRICEGIGKPYKRRERSNSYHKPDLPVRGWSKAEDEKLKRLVARHAVDASLSANGGKYSWRKIAREFGDGRTQQAIRNRSWRLNLFVPDTTTS